MSVSIETSFTKQFERDVHEATHYHAAQITPEWAQGRTPRKTIGKHIFFRIVEQEEVV